MGHSYKIRRQHKMKHDTRSDVILSSRGCAKLDNDMQNALQPETKPSYGKIRR